MTRTVFVVNHREQDMKPAEKFGKILVLVEGKANIFGVDKVLGELKIKLKDSRPEDYVMLCGSLLLNSLVTGLWVVKHPKLKLLMWDFRTSSYVERILDQGDFQ